MTSMSTIPIKVYGINLLVRMMEGPEPPADDPMVLGGDDLLAYPDLIDLLAEPPAAEDDGPPGRWDSLTDPVRAAAVLLEPPQAIPTGEPGEGPLDRLAAWFRAWLGVEWPGVLLKLALIALGLLCLRRLRKRSDPAA